MRRLVLSIIVAAVLWSVMFSPCTAPHVPFWPAMSVSAVTLLSLGLWGRAHAFVRTIAALVRQPRAVLIEAALATVIAAALWGIFALGNVITTHLFNFARTDIAQIYGLKDGTSSLLLSVLLLCVIGPAEELFWRGYIQRTLASRCTSTTAMVIATVIYAAVHAPSLNPMLLAAALTCGAVWGALYRFFPHHFPAIVLSHALWDAAVFVWFPIA